MAPRPRASQGDANNGILNQPREKTIRKPKLSSTPISEVFLKACEERDWKKINACLELGVDINCTGSDNHSALYNSVGFYCYLSGNRKVSDFLIGHPDLDVDQINREGILKISCGTWQKGLLRKLCALPGIDVNAGNPLERATLYHNVAAIKILAENPDLNWNAGGDVFQTPIFRALSGGYVDILELLLSQPTLVLSRTDYKGNSVGHFAVEYSFVKEFNPGELNVSAFPVKCVELLSKDPRMNWNVRNKKGETPIMVALKNKEKDMVKILLKNPNVYRGDIMKTQEGNDILTEMLQEADQENGKLPSKVPDCPVSIYCLVVPCKI